ncbi:hypothetical protein AVEN_26401-1 [Araneus ventricosus]|uniref:Uncharacterized protein n=1 Tax=Araneus ventricosus TaxID=182803 RepID=A0A4Y2WRM1_ARAVE|nr:hypothetical protein AVEN_26401-1 [Araneus ventricosus]
MAVSAIDSSRHRRQTRTQTLPFISIDYRFADGSLISQLNELRKRIKEIGQTAGKVRERLDEGEEYRRYGLDNITLAEDAIQQAKDAAAAARKYLDTQGRDAYLSALDRKDRLGQQSNRLSQIAREARQLADQ